MAFTATPSSVTIQNNQFVITVLFKDDATSFTSNKTYLFPNDGSLTQQGLVSQITADGQVIKTSLSTLAVLQAKVGTVITI